MANSAKPQGMRRVSKPQKTETAELDALFLSIGEGIIVTDKSGNISRINDIALSLLGYTQQEILGKWYPEVVVAEDIRGNIVHNIDRPNTEVFITGQPVYRRLIYVRKDSSRVPVAVTAAPVIVGGNPVGAIEMLRDISAEVEVEHAKDEFISIASHELRTPATIVKQYIRMVLDGYFGDVPEAQRPMLENAYDSNERQLNIINTMLQVAHAEADELHLDRRKTDIVELAKHVFDEQSEKYKDLKHKMEFTYRPKTIEIEVDPLHVRMIIENLLSNAHKYTPSENKIHLALDTHDEGVRITVKDEGVGIDERDRSKLFRKFSRIDNPLAVTAGGSGLGLFWVKKLVELHQGTIEVISHPGKGSIFRVHLPFVYDSSDI